MKKNRRIIVRGVRKERPDIRRLSRAIIEMAQAQAEAEAQAEHRQSKTAASKASGIGQSSNQASSSSDPQQHSPTDDQADPGRRSRP